MTDAQRINFLAGQVHALVTFAGAVIKTHPNAQALRVEIDRLHQVALALTESRLVSDEYIDGMRETRDSLGAF